MKLTTVLFATGETSTVLLIFKTTGTTVTLVWFLTTVLFSSQVTLTQFVNGLTIEVTFTIARIHNLISGSSLNKQSISHLAPLPYCSVLLTTPLGSERMPASTNVKPSGNSSMTTTPFASPSSTLLTVIVKVT